MSVLEAIVRDLETLPPPKLMEVARYVRALQPDKRQQRDAALSATAGCLAGEAGEDFEQAVKAEADRVHADSQ